MKKNLLLVLAVVISTTAMMSQKRLDKQLDRSSLVQSKEAKSMVLKENLSVLKHEAAVESVSFNKVKGEKAPQAGLSYSKPAGTFHSGLFYVNDDEFTGVTTNYPTIISKANYNSKFVATGGSNYTWTVKDSDGKDVPLKTDAQGNGIYNLGGVGSYYPPTVKSGSNTYIWHKEVSRQFVAFSDALRMLSMVDVWRGGDGTGWGAKVGTFSGYVYGTGFSTATGKVIGCIQNYDKPQAPLYIESVNISVLSSNNNPLPNGSKMICSIVPVDADGKWGFDKIIAQSECTADDLEDWGLLSQDGTKFFNAPFYFYEKDPDSGIVSPMDLMVSEAFAIVLEWEGNANFGCLFSESDTDPGNAWLFDDSDKAYQYYVSGNEPYKIDLLFNINGVMPELKLFSDIESIYFLPEGGNSQVKYSDKVYSNALFESTFGADEGDVYIEEEKLPNWVKVIALENEYENNYFMNYLSLVLSADPLPNNITTRSADITLRTHGISETIHVIQGAGAGILSPSNELISAVRSGDDFILKYPVSATSVSVYNVVGQKTGEFKLSASGTYTLPVANLSKGSYVLKFNDEKSTTIKVLR